MEFFKNYLNYYLCTWKTCIFIHLAYVLKTCTCALKWKMWVKGQCQDSVTLSRLAPSPPPNIDCFLSTNQYIAIDSSANVSQLAVSNVPGATVNKRHVSRDIYALCPCNCGHRHQLISRLILHRTHNIKTNMCIRFVLKERHLLVPQFLFYQGSKVFSYWYTTVNCVTLSKSSDQWCHLLRKI